jgi:hypothetical protein
MVSASIKPKFQSPYETYDDVVSSLDPGAQASVANWNRRTSDRVTEILRSSVYFNSAVMDVAEAWENRRQKIAQHPIVDQFERSESERYGPLSLQSDWDERKSDAESQIPSRQMSVNEAAYAAALDDVRRLLPTGSLEAISAEEARLRSPRDTNLGLPEFRRNDGDDGSYLQRAKDFVKGKGFIYPDVAGWRGQAGGYFPEPWSRDRLLYMGDHAETYAGGRYMHPVVDALKLRGEFAAWLDLDRVSDAVLALLKRARRSRVKVYSTDFSSFDASCPERLILDIFDAIRGWIRKVDSDFDAVVEHFVRGFLLTPGGLLGPRSGGIPSGSVFTNLIGTLINYLCARYIVHRLGLSTSFGTYLGDDAVNVYEPEPALDEIEDVGTELNLDLNAEKQYVAEGSAHYLQNVYVLDGNQIYRGGGIRPTHRILNGILHYERRRSGGDWPPMMANIRTISQLENGKYNEAFRSLVSFTAEGDTRLFGFKATRAVRLAGGVKKVDSVLGTTAFRYTQRSSSGLSDFATVKVLESIS